LNSRIPARKQNGEAGRKKKEARASAQEYENEVNKHQNSVE
jgi:hypothetical protein